MIACQTEEFFFIEESSLPIFLHIQIRTYVDLYVMDKSYISRSVA